MNTQEMIEVMKAFDDGKAIQFRNKGSEFEWFLATVPIWDWDAIIYRVKVELSLEDRIKAEFSDKRVVMLEFDDRDRLVMPDAYLHIDAQSMKNFAGYVYNYGKGFQDFHEPIDTEGDKVIQPIAVLFEAEK